MIAGTHSGVGKTTLTAGLIYALRRRGHRVIPFKVGPDYIDPGFHSAAAGEPAGNLDSWMVKPAQVQEIMHRRVPEGAIAIIEGVMGIYDGRKGMGEIGSSAHVAKITGTPVILVASGAKMARSAAALVGGYLHFDRDVPFAGIVLNHLSGDRHYHLLKGEINEHLQVPVLGYLPKEAAAAVPERHLGLLPAAETENLTHILGALADLVEKHVDVDALLDVAATAGPLPLPENTLFPEQANPATCRIAYASDEAFHFYYPENLELLRYLGAELIPFSPLHDQSLPPDTHGLLLGGGFPEMFASALSENNKMRSAIKQAAKAGTPMYAECGGYMYLARELVDFEGQSRPMAGVFPGRAVMRSSRRALGYVEAVGSGDNPLLPAGECCRGHEFHWSDMEEGSHTPLYHKLQGGEAAGERVGHVMGSYLHLHFLSNPNVARRFVAICTDYAHNGGGQDGE
jgi:cobyrinic acid a,c-diamide synthase